MKIFLFPAVHVRLINDNPVKRLIVGNNVTLSCKWEGQHNSIVNYDWSIYSATTSYKYIQYSDLNFLENRANFSITIHKVSTNENNLLVTCGVLCGIYVHDYPDRSFILLVTEEPATISADETTTTSTTTIMQATLTGTEEATETAETTETSNEMPSRTNIPDKNNTNLPTITMGTATMGTTTAGEGIAEAMNSTKVSPIACSSGGTFLYIFVGALCALPLALLITCSTTWCYGRRTRGPGKPSAGQMPANQ